MNRAMTAQHFHAACICLGLNRAARVTARRYDAAFRPAGITSGQFSILSALLRDTPATMGGLADILGMERTTLKRNLDPLEKLGLILTTPSEADRRIRHVTLTTAGHILLDQALPLWRRAQQDAGRRLGPTPWSDVLTLLETLA